MLKKLLPATGVGMLIAGSAAALPVTVDVWDVIAEYDTQCGCTPNPTEAEQIAARVAAGNTNYEVDNEDPHVGEFAGDGTTYLEDALYVVGNVAADATTSIDSSVLSSGNGLYETGLGITGDFVTIGDFLGVNPAGDDIFDNPLLGTVLRLTATVDLTSGTNYSIVTDDGYKLTARSTFNDEVYSAELNGLHNSAQTSFNFGGTSGAYDIELVWYDTQRTAARLDIDSALLTRTSIPNPVPLPAGVWLLGTALAGAGVVSRRRRKTA